MGVREGVRRRRKCAASSSLLIGFCSKRCSKSNVEMNWPKKNE